MGIVSAHKPSSLKSKNKKGKIAKVSCNEVRPDIICPPDGVITIEVIKIAILGTRVTITLDNTYSPEEFIKIVVSIMIVANAKNTDMGGYIDRYNIMYGNATIANINDILLDSNILCLKLSLSSFSVPEAIIFLI
jgi:hypothetical protein